MRVVATRIEWDGAMQRRVVDTASCSDSAQWEDLATRALAIPPPYRPVPGCAIYHLSADDHVVLVAEHDLCGPLLDLVTAVLAVGGEPRLRNGAVLAAAVRVSERADASGPAHREILTT